MKLNQAIIKIRVDLQNKKLRKTGKNKHAGFSYFELKDFLPTLNKLMLDAGINDRYTIEDGNATLYLIKEEESNKYSMPFTMFDTPLANSGKKMMQDIQYLGALNTYYKRYLYLNAFGITDGDVIDGMPTPDELGTPKAPTYQKPKQTDEELQMQQLTTQAKLDKKKFLDESLLECGSDKTLWTKLMKQTVLALGAKEYKDLDFMQTSKFVVKGKFLELLEQHNKLKESGV